MNLEELMSIYQDKLNPTDWKIYNLLKENKKNSLTIQELADLAYVSTTTIYRYCQKIGLSGFGELSAIMRLDQPQKRTFNFDDLKSYYHMIVRYIDQYNTLHLFEALNQSDVIYIYAQSIIELRIAREMVRIFMPIGKIISIISNPFALENHISKFDGNLLIFITVDSKEKYPIAFKNYMQLQQAYIVLLGHKNDYLLTFDDHLLLPESELLPAQQINYTKYMMSIEILYLKYRLNYE